jgi:DnaA family protein
MSQLALDLLTRVAPSLDNFVAGSNRECLQRLRALADGDRRHRLIYLWGLPGCGRSHLAGALARALPQACVVDDVQRLDAGGQTALFGRFLAAAADPDEVVITTGDRPPLALDLREDLRSRLGAGLVFELRAPDDTGRAQALAQAARERGLRLPEGVISWLLTHHARDLRVLMATLEALDRHALARQRAPSLPLLREWLAGASGGRDTPTADKIL